LDPAAAEPGHYCAPDRRAESSRKFKPICRSLTFVLASVWLYQVRFLTNYREGKPLACIKDHLDCARRRIPNG
jgi:hypothetical protein